MKFSAVFLILVPALVAALGQYDGYKVYRATPENDVQREMLHTLEKVGKFDFWSSIRANGKPVDFMVDPKSQSAVEFYLRMFKMQHEILINDVEKVVQLEKARNLRSPKAGPGKIGFERYYRYDEINAYLQELATNYPNLVTVQAIGQSYEGRDINLVTISSGGGGSKPAILIDGGIHAREWIAPAQCLYMLQELIENPANSDLSANVDWYIIPLLNPDGYEYSHDVERMWRKTRKPNRLCVGVDANRNYGYQWNTGGSSNNECDLTYHGPSPFSEVEIVAIRDFTNANKDQIVAHISYHSYGQYILYPWGFTRDPPNDQPELDYLGNLMGDAIGIGKYEVGGIVDVLYVASGGANDWIKAVAGIQMTFTIELPGGGSEGFDLPPDRIDPVVKETWPAMTALHSYVSTKYKGSNFVI